MRSLTLGAAVKHAEAGTAPEKLCSSGGALVAVCAQEQALLGVVVSGGGGAAAVAAPAVGGGGCIARVLRACVHRRARCVSSLLPRPCRAYEWL